MAQIRQYNRATDTTYVFESQSYWDPDKRQSRSKRRCIGKIDKETGEIVPTGGRGRKKKPEPAKVEITGEEELKKEVSRLREELEEKERKLSALRQKTASLEEENRMLRKACGEAERLGKERGQQMERIAGEAGAFAERIRKLCGEQQGGFPE